MSPTDDHALHHSSLSNLATDWIAQRILEGSIAPGQKITEIWLAEQMGISRSPVREALRFLSRDGLVVLEPRRGARVGQLDRRHAEDLYGCRLMVEPPCIGLAVQALDAPRREQLDALFTQMRKLRDVNDATGYVSVLQEYNLKTLELCPNRILFGLAETTWRGSLRYWNLLVRGREDYIGLSLTRNESIHLAAMAGDAERAEQMAAELLEKSRDELRTLLSNLSK
jgi:DNA-binding GntR family transcriptional regulator